MTETTTPEVTLESLSSHVWHLTQRVSDLEQSNKELLERATSAEDRLVTYRAEVRTAIIDAQQKHDLCVDGTNSVLESLELDPIATDWLVTVTNMYGSHIGDVTVDRSDADTETEAIEYVRSRIEYEPSEATIKAEVTIYGSSDSESGDDESDDCDAISSSWIEGQIESLTITAEAA